MRRHHRGDEDKQYVGGKRATYIWSKQVKERENFQCQYCGSKDKLESHHIKPWKDYPELRYNPDNGMCLCKKCHSQKHKYLPERKRQTNDK